MLWGAEHWIPAFFTGGTRWRIRGDQACDLPQQRSIKTVFCGHFRVHLHKCLFLDGLLWARGSQVSSLQAFVEAIS
jgi:hypothetical protein